jgi:hypothetical protein
MKNQKDSTQVGSFVFRGDFWIGARTEGMSGANKTCLGWHVWPDAFWASKKRGKSPGKPTMWAFQDQAALVFILGQPFQLVLTVPFLPLPSDTPLESLWTTESTPELKLSLSVWSFYPVNWKSLFFVQDHHYWRIRPIRKWNWIYLLLSLWIVVTLNLSR